MQIWIVLYVNHFLDFSRGLHCNRTKQVFKCSLVRRRHVKRIKCDLDSVRYQFNYSVFRFDLYGETSEQVHLFRI